MRNRKIILDTDPGIDDAIAIAVLLNACAENVKLILTSYGNTSVENTTRNATALVALLGAVIPVARGAERPAPGGNGTYEDAAYVHGSDGLGGMQRGLLESLNIKKAASGDYLKLLHDAIASEESVDYITLGPLTNLSGFIYRYPEAARKINLAVVMGGGIEKGNVTADAEFNIFCDAESANHVFSTMPDIMLVPLDATTKVAFGMPGIDKISSAGTKVAGVMASILRTNYDLCAAYGDAGAVMHDSTAVLAYLYPELFGFRTGAIKVATEKERYGKCLYDANGGNVKIADSFDPNRLLDIIAESIIKYRGTG